MRKLARSSKFAFLCIIATSFLAVLSLNVSLVHAQQSAYGAEWVADDVFYQPTVYPKSMYVETVSTTYFVYMRNVTGVYKFYAKQYNHTTSTMSSEIHIGDSAGTDQHNTPAIGHLPNGIKLKMSLRQ